MHTTAPLPPQLVACRIEPQTHCRPLRALSGENDVPVTQVRTSARLAAEDSLLTRSGSLLERWSSVVVPCVCQVYNVKSVLQYNVESTMRMYLCRP